MKHLQLINQSILKQLSYISDFIDDNEEILTKNSMKGSSGIVKQREDPCSLKYLQTGLQDPKDYDYPQHSYGINIRHAKPHLKLSKNYNIIETIINLGEFLGCPTNALAMYYPPGGFLGWHHNGNAPGYNVLFTYNQTGDGKF